MAPSTPSPSPSPVNDGAVISGNDTGAVLEDESTPTLTETGSLTVTDVDGADEAKFVPATAWPAMVPWAA
ncbi:hypothetical protein [Aeromonas salmonicida]|uniref:hypothetical protein n=1 Tax=Aeromonas salmonicida TaxID=645 RepID=UPI001E2A2785|nr:hypothetical protein [Aeromonas salmonicida]